MDAPFPVTSSPRLRFRIWGVSLPCICGFYYLLICESDAPGSLTPTQVGFLLGYSLLLAVVTTFALTRMLFAAKPARWLDSIWKRLVVVTVAAITLAGLAAVLPLPPFYYYVLQHTTVFLILPLAWSRRSLKDNWLYCWSNAGNGKVPAISTTEDVILPVSRRKALVALVGSLVFVTVGWLMLPKMPVMGWMSLVFSGLGLVASLLLMLPGLAFLKLQANGFTMRHLWRRYFFRWNEISDLTVASISQMDRVAFNHHVAGMRRSALVREMYGRDMALFDNYGLSASTLCALMRERQAAAITAPA